MSNARYVHVTMTNGVFESRLFKLTESALRSGTFTRTPGRASGCSAGGIA